MYFRKSESLSTNRLLALKKIHEFVIVHVPTKKDWKEPLYLLDQSLPRFSLIVHRRHLVGGIEKVRQHCLWVLRLRSEKWSKKGV